MERLRFGPADRRQAIRWFSAGKRPTHPFEALAEQCLTQARRAPVLLEMVLECLCRTAELSEAIDLILSSR